MRYLRAEEIKSALFVLIKRKGMLPYGVGKRQFWANITKYISIKQYCRLVVAILKKKGVDMDYVREKMMMCNSYSGTIERRNKNGNRLRIR